MKYSWFCVNKSLIFPPWGCDRVEQVFTAKPAKKGYDKTMECEREEYASAALKGVGLETWKQGDDICAAFAIEVSRTE